MNEKTLHEAIDCDYRDGLVSIGIAEGFQRTLAYEVKYAPGSGPELDEATKGIKAAFPTARIFRGERELIVMP